MAASGDEVWYLREWFAAQDMIQRDLVTKLDWLPAKAHKIWHGLQPPKLHEAAEIAKLLNIETYELLMPPEKAMAMRRLRAAVTEVVGGPGESEAAKQEPETPAARSTRRTGTSG